MNAKDAINQQFDWSDRIVGRYLEDLSDGDLLIRPVEGMNHIAWQLGHLITSERRMVEQIRPGSSPDLPEGFEANHGREDTASDDPAQYASKAEYLRLMQAQRAATKGVIDSLSEADLDAPAPEGMRKMCPTVGSVLVLAGGHVTMHVGQWVAVRRKLQKPVAI